MPRDLASLLRETAAEPAEPLAPATLVARARRRHAARMAIGAVGAVAAFGLAASAMSLPLTRPRSPDILGQAPEQVVSSPAGDLSPTPGLTAPPLPAPAPAVAPPAASESQPAPPPPAPAPAAAETPSDSPSPSASASTSPSAAAVEESRTCPRTADPRVPPGSGCVSSKDADLDGDGTVEAVLVYAHLDERRVPTSWHLRSATSATGTLDLDITARVDTHQPALYTQVGRVGDVDGDGRDEVLVQLTSGASTTFWGLFTLDRGGLASVVVAGSGPIVIPLGGSVTHQDSMRCEVQDGRHLLVLHATRYQSDGAAYTWTDRIYGWTGEHLDLVDTRTGQGSGQEPPKPDGCAWRA